MGKLYKNISAIALFLFSLSVAATTQENYLNDSLERVGFIKVQLGDNLKVADLEDDGKILIQKLQTLYFEKYSLKAWPYSPIFKSSESEILAKLKANKQACDSCQKLAIDALKAKSKALYPLYKVGDIVSVRFQITPLRSRSVGGILEEISPERITVGTAFIRIKDMAGIAGNEREVMKFQEKTTKLARENFIKEQVNNYKNKISNLVAEFYLTELVKQKNIFNNQNLKNGYICNMGIWENPLDIIIREVKSEITTMRFKTDYRDIIAKREVERKAKIAAIAAAAIATTTNENGDDTVTTIDPVTPDPTEAENGDDSEDESGFTFTENNDSKKEESKKKPLPWAWIAGVIVFIVMLIIIKVAMKKRMSAYDFFMPTINNPADFWHQAETNADHFKYIAYSYPSNKIAKRAFKRLSYMRGEGLNLSCDHDIEYGHYSDGKRIVTFIGGTSFTYAQWREASAIFPEVRGAEYYRVSTPPEIKDSYDEAAEHALADQYGLSYMRETIERENNNRTCRLYSGEDRENALTFLRELDILGDLCIKVQVGTDSWGKDANGVFQD